MRWWLEGKKGKVKILKEKENKSEFTLALLGHGGVSSRSVGCFELRSSSKPSPRLSAHVFMFHESETFFFRVIAGGREDRSRLGSCTSNRTTMRRKRERSAIRSNGKVETKQRVEPRSLISECFMVGKRSFTLLERRTMLDLPIFILVWTPGLENKEGSKRVRHTSKRFRRFERIRYLLSPIGDIFLIYGEEGKKVSWRKDR